MCSWPYRGHVRGAANRPGVILKSRHRDYTSTSCQTGSESAHSKMKAAECDNRAAFDGHALTGSIGSDELEDTHSPMLRPKKTHPNWLTCQAGRAPIMSQATLAFKSQPASCSASFSAGSQSQVVAGITFSEAPVQQQQSRLVRCVN